MNAILCFGDSITFGRGESPCIGWCGRLKEWFESKNEYNAVYNLGIPGETSKGLLNRFEIELTKRVRYLREEDKFTVIIAIGTNDLSSADGKHLIKINEFESNIRKLYLFAKKTVDTVYVLSIPPAHTKLGGDWEDSSYMNEDVDRYNHILEEVTTDDFVKLTFLDWDSKVPDGIHPDSIGYADMFNQIKILFE